MLIFILPAEIGRPEDVSAQKHKFQMVSAMLIINLIQVNFCAHEHPISLHGNWQLLD